MEDGNNSDLIKNIARKRIGWRVVESVNVANMIWSPFFRVNIESRYQRRFKDDKRELFFNDSHSVWTYWKIKFHYREFFFWESYAPFESDKGCPVVILNILKEVSLYLGIIGIIVAEAVRKRHDPRESGAKTS